MGYNNFKTCGKIVKIDSVHLEDNLSDPELLSPSQVLFTRIDIEKRKGQKLSIQVYCAIPQEYLNQNVKLLESYFKNEDKEVRVYTQHLYINNRLIMDQTIVRKA
jgi:hypothetical protein